MRYRPIQRKQSTGALNAHGATRSSAVLPDRAATPVARLLNLQQTLGNRHVQQLLQHTLIQRKCNCNRETGSAGACAGCSEDRMSIQRRAANHAEPAAAPQVVQEALRGGGQPLDVPTRALMESQFQHDFSRVRVHTGGQAAASARAVNAVAFTVGRNIFFDAGRYAPATTEGRRLLAHELTHVVQQSGAPAVGQAKLTVGAANTEAEREADRVAKQVVGGNGAARVSSHAPGLVQRKCEVATPADCADYEKWLDTFPHAGANVSNIISGFPAAMNPGEYKYKGEALITDRMPKDLKDLITGKLSAGGGLPDCADVSFLLRHYYLKAKGQSTSFMVGPTKDKSETFTLGKNTSDKEMRACMIGSGTETFQETRKGFAVVNFYKNKGKNITNLKELIAAGLKPGDMFVWKRSDPKATGFQGHAQTVSEVVPPKVDPKDPKVIIAPGVISVVQGNMQGGKGVGRLEYRLMTFAFLTGRGDGNADIRIPGPDPEENFFGAGPWK